MKQDYYKSDTPPLGLVPKHVHQVMRLNDINEAIQRYLKAGMIPLQEWCEEATELVVAIKHREDNY